MLESVVDPGALQVWPQDLQCVKGRRKQSRSLMTPSHSKTPYCKEVCFICQLSIITSHINLGDVPFNEFCCAYIGFIEESMSSTCRDSGLIRVRQKYKGQDYKVKIDSEFGQLWKFPCYLSVPALWANHFSVHLIYYITTFSMLKAKFYLLLQNWNGACVI